jgi:hypothetical protein
LEIKGSLRDDHLPDLLQALVSLGKSGTLMLEEGRGPLASVTFDRGRLRAARCRHLSGEEALLGCLFWNQGSFYFQDDLGVAPTPAAGDLLPAPFDLSRFLIRALFLADELERRRALVPAADASLALTGGSAPDDPFPCGVEQVLGAVEQRPGVSRAGLESDLALAPVKVRLALALLLEVGAIEERSLPGRESASLPAAPHWWSTLGGGGGTVRILITGDEQQFSAASFYTLAESLAAQLGAAEPWTSFLPHGPSFIRLRPATGGLLSLSLMPSDGRDGSLDCLAFAAAHDLVVAVGTLPPECLQKLSELQHHLIRLENLAQFEKQLTSLPPPINVQREDR